MTKILTAPDRFLTQNMCFLRSPIVPDAPRPASVVHMMLFIVKCTFCVFLCGFLAFVFSYETVIHCLSIINSENRWFNILILRQNFDLLRAFCYCFSPKRKKEGWIHCQNKRWQNFWTKLETRQQKLTKIINNNIEQRKKEHKKIIILFYIFCLFFYR